MSFQDAQLMLRGVFVVSFFWYAGVALIAAHTHRDDSRDFAVKSLLSSFVFAVLAGSMLTWLVLSLIRL
jgi:hypothetical protein